jgi:phospholipid/cholesterol/gamma-HCH transport system substrate-binding protein
MATEARKFQLGVFIISATVIGVAALIWLGASRFFEKTTRLATYFSESVQGLEPGSSVKYRGVPAGRVEKIGIAPDGDLIEVLMGVENEFADMVGKDPTLRAQLQLAGITGLRYVEIDRHSGEPLTRYPELKFESPYTVIRSAPSSVKAVQEALEDIYGQVMAADVKGISKDVRTTLMSANKLLQDERIPQILTNLRVVSESAGNVTRNLEQTTKQLRLEPAIENLTAASAEAKALFGDLRDGESGEKFRHAMEQIAQLARGGRQFVVTLQYTAERINRAIGNLERLTEEVRSQPSRLFFSLPPEPRHPGAGEPR